MIHDDDKKYNLKLIKCAFGFHEMVKDETLKGSTFAVDQCKHCPYVEIYEVYKK